MIGWGVLNLEKMYFFINWTKLFPSLFWSAEASTHLEYNQLLLRYTNYQMKSQTGPWNLFPKHQKV